ncbi:GFA family protein [Jannaschia ovalis]|uniref:GFA family protein n=1 Tax=Jannaschia ovalis TaxID=3038773 RepID=A0ABY8LBH7_9RHOB|nr:GFA family protein [Jannaschia sp. GRR-S6-38]WGH77533.1 GFA family protein [Jannaschia sp. GRR-S6-38]
MNGSEPRRLTCHCGRAELRVTLAEPASAARRCDCSFCRRRQAGNVDVRDGDMEVVRGETLTLYQFGTHTAEHYFCSVCGCYTHHRRLSDPSVMGVNVAGLDGVNPRASEPMPWVDGADADELSGAAR